MKVVLSYVLTPIFFLFFGLSLAVFHPIQFIALNLFGSKTHDKSVALLNFCLKSCPLILGTRTSYKGFRKLPLDRPVLLVSNHQSMWDIPPIIWKIRKNRVKFIAKSSLAKNIPSISYNLKYGGSVSINRRNPEESIQKIKDFAAYIKENKYAICIYPEGTRSRDGIVKPFKFSGIDAILKVIPDIIVVPIAVKNTGLIDNAKKFNKNIGIHISFSMLESRTVNRDNLEKELEGIRQEIIEEIK